MKTADHKRRFIRSWASNFWAAAITLLVIKLILLGYTVLSPATRGEVPIYNYLLKIFLVLGADILGAALVATVAAVLCLPAQRLRMPRLELATGAVVQVANAVFGGMSFFTIIFIGGPINKQAIDLSIMSAPKEQAFFGEALAGSIGEYVSVGTVSLLAALGALSVAALVLAPRFLPRLTGLKRRVAIILLAAEAVVTVLIMPFLASGEIGGIRVYTYGLEKSPVVELGWSYLKTMTPGWAADAELIDDEWTFDFTGFDKAPAAEPPLARVTTKKTNLVVVAMESVGAPYMEDPAGHMPFFHDLGRRPGAQLFWKNYSTWSLTSKAFFTVYASELPYPNYKAESIVNPAVPAVTLSEVLHENGYFTAFVTGQDLAYDRQSNFFQHRELDLVWDGRNIPGATEDLEIPWGLDDRFVVDRVLDVARDHKDEPFFIYYGMTAGHHPFLPCKEHADSPMPTREENYDRALEFIDDRIKDLYEGLEREGLMDNTLLVVFSDHGDGHGRYMGRNVWEPVIRVPLLMYGPQLGDAAGETEIVTSLMDLSPTVLSTLGLDVPCTMKGRDLTRTGERRISLFGGRPPQVAAGPGGRRLEVHLGGQEPRDALRPLRGPGRGSQPGRGTRGARGVLQEEDRPVVRLLHQSHRELPHHPRALRLRPPLAQPPFDRRSPRPDAGKNETAGVSSSPSKPFTLPRTMEKPRSLAMMKEASHALLLDVEVRGQVTSDALADSDMDSEGQVEPGRPWECRPPRSPARSV